MNRISHSDFYFPDNDFCFNYPDYDEVDDCDSEETFDDYEIENELRYEIRAIIQDELNGLQTDFENFEFDYDFDTNQHNYLAYKENAYLQGQLKEISGILKEKYAKLHFNHQHKEIPFPVKAHLN